MSYAIVRNEKLTRAEVNGKGTHNDRKAKNHTNKDIDTTKTHLNYYIKKNELTYTKEFDKYLKENNIEVVHISCKCRDQIRCRHIQHIRQCDLEENLNGICPVYPGCLIKICRDILKNTCQLKQCIRNTYPDIDHDHSHSRPGRICEKRETCILRDPP